jgi:hypothetical protein
MLALMLDPKYRNVKLVNIYLHCEIVATLIIEYDKQLLLPLLLEAYNLLTSNRVQDLEKST